MLLTVLSIKDETEIIVRPWVAFLTSWISSKRVSPGASGKLKSQMRHMISCS